MEYLIQTKIELKEKIEKLEQLHIEKLKVPLGTSRLTKTKRLDFTQIEFKASSESKDGNPT